MVRSPAWTTFVCEIADLSPKHLAAKLNREDVTNDTVSNWKAGKSTPDLQLLPEISKALGRDATYLAQKMGIIPNSDDAVRQIRYLNRRLGDLHSELDEFDELVANRRDQAVGHITAEAARTGRWAVAVWPAREGPEGFKVHVSDRLDFTRVDGGPVTHEALCGEKTLYKLLTKSHAIHSPNLRPRWGEFEPTVDGTENPSPQHSGVIRLSIPRLPSTFTPGTTTTIRNQGSVAVVALTVHSWAMDTAGFLARMFNYGLTSSRSQATETHGWRTERISDREVKFRSQLHESMMKHPETRYVWAHFRLASDPRELFPNPEGWPDTLTCVWVRESDDLLKAALEKSPKALEKCIAARNAVDEYVKLINVDRIITVEAGYPLDSNGSPLPLPLARDFRMENAMKNAVESIEDMIKRGFVSREEIESTVALMKEESGPPSRRTRSSIAHTTYRWLAAQGKFGASTAKS